MTKDVLDYVTLGIAVLGAVLGVVNAWRTWSMDRVRLKVSISHGVDSMGGRILLVNAVNLSAFDLTVTRVGFHLLGRRRHMQIPVPFLTSGDKLPVCLKPRTAVTAVVQFGAGDHVGWHSVESVYVGTACGLEVVGGRRFFKNNQVHFAAAYAQQVV